MKNKNTDFDISFATYNDVEDILNLLYPSYFEESAYSKLEYDPVATRLTVQNWLDEVVVLVRVDGKLAGIMSMYFIKTFYKQSECEVVMFYVHPDYRGTGIGRSLVNAIVMLSDKNEAAVIYTTSGSGMNGNNNNLYVNLFKKFGFENLGTELIKINV